MQGIYERQSDLASFYFIFYRLTVFNSSVLWAEIPLVHFKLLALQKGMNCISLSMHHFDKWLLQLTVVESETLKNNSFKYPCYLTNYFEPIWGK